MAKVLKSPPGAQDREGREVLGSRKLGLFWDPGDKNQNRIVPSDSRNLLQFMEEFAIRTGTR